MKKEAFRLSIMKAKTYLKGLIMDNSITLIPAYGRDYKNKKEVLKDFEENKDFLIADFFHPYDGKPANKTDLKDYSMILIRYNKLQKILNTKG